MGGRTRILIDVNRVGWAFFWPSKVAQVRAWGQEMTHAEFSREEFFDPNASFLTKYWPHFSKFIGPPNKL